MIVTNLTPGEQQVTENPSVYLPFVSSEGGPYRKPVGRVLRLTPKRPVAGSVSPPELAPWAPSSGHQR